MSKVVFMPEVEYYLRELTDVLFEKEYFGFKESAVQYVRCLISEIENTLDLKLKRLAPDYFKKYGDCLYYSFFSSKNRNTTWYVFFSTYQDVDNELIYLVTYISNNHVIGHLLD